MFGFKEENITQLCIRETLNLLCADISTDANQYCNIIYGFRQENAYFLFKLILNYKMEKILKLVNEGSVINRTYPI